MTLKYFVVQLSTNNLRFDYPLHTCSHSVFSLSLSITHTHTHTQTHTPELICIEDYIALQEIIVPVVVGGILSFLLVVIFFSYLVAYFRRKSRESKQYEPVPDDKF